MSDLNYQIYNSVHEIPLDWDRIHEDVFLNIPYLTAQENALPIHMNVFYIGVFQMNQLVGKAIVQRVRTNANELFRRNPNVIKQNLLQILNLNMLCLGNLKLTGEHAFVYDKKVDELEILLVLKKALNEMTITSRSENKPIQLILIKDFYKDSLEYVHQVFKDYELLSVQPNMVLELRKDWKCFEDYLDSMRTKYRTRAKRAFKKSENIRFKSLNLKEIIENQDLIYPLYLNVLENAGFSLYKLPKNYFEEMKRQMPYTFHFYGGFYQEKLVCFFSMIENHEQIETGFLGYDKDLQKEHQLYLNILYQMTKYAIEHGFDHIDYSRTAMEIKSSIGAEPIEAYGFLKHTNPLMNSVLKSLFKKFYQQENWIQRKPFKA